jgi:hypothetical protein
MFGRHRSTPDQDVAILAEAFHERLAGSMVSRRTDPPRIDPNNLRGRLGGSPTAGLRERLDRRFDRRLSPT